MAANDEVSRLLLQIDASTELARQELKRMDSALGQTEQKTAQSAGRMAASYTNMTRSVASHRAGMQQLGFQIQDIAAQAANGTSAFVIFAQQSGQVAGAMAMMSGRVGMVGAALSGPWGAAVLAGTTILAPFIAKLFDTSDALGGVGDKAVTAANSIRDLLSYDVTGTAKRAQDVGMAQVEVARLKGERQRLLSPSGPAAYRHAASGLAEQDLRKIDDQIIVAETALTAARVRMANEARLKALAQPSRAGGGGGGSARVGGAGAGAKATLTDAQLRLGWGAAEGGIGPSVTAAEGLSNGADKLRDTFLEVRDLSKEISSAEIIDPDAIKGADQVKSLLLQGAIYGGDIGDALVKSFVAAGAAAALNGLFDIFGVGSGKNKWLDTAFSFLGTALTGKAVGGPVMGGQPYLVGERGPELFLPSMAGRIVPHGQMGGGGPAPIFDLRGAVVTEDLLAQMQALAAQGAIAAIGVGRSDAAAARRMRLPRGLGA